MNITSTTTIADYMIEAQMFTNKVVLSSIHMNFRLLHRLSTICAGRPPLLWVNLWISLGFNIGGNIRGYCEYTSWPNIWQCSNCHIYILNFTRHLSELVHKMFCHLVWHDKWVTGADSQINTFRWGLTLRTIRKLTSEVSHTFDCSTWQH